MLQQDKQRGGEQKRSN